MRTCQWCRHKNTARAEWVAANGIVHMIPYCLQVLQGRVPEQNERKITKPVAIILLAHYVADIHQPLHVGTEYFDARGRPADPDKEKSALADEVGNTFTLELSDEPPRSGRKTAAGPSELSRVGDERRPRRIAQSWLAPC